MSLTTIYRASTDSALLQRVEAAAQQEAIAGAVKDSVMAQSVRSSPSWAAQMFIYSVAIEYRDAYEYAVNADNPNPGGDPAVITDANILAAIQANWPEDPVVTP